MDNPALTASALLNAAAVWFIFKAIEVIVFVIYDSYSAIAKWLRDRANPDPDPHEITYERRRGWIEYVLSGTGFLNRGLFRQRRILLLFISTSIPVSFFILELLSITLGNESRTCKTSTDPNEISSPSLVLFGRGKRHVDLSTLIEQEGLGVPLNNFRPCVSWSSTHAGVDFLSSLCANTVSTFGHSLVSERTLRFNQPTGVYLAQPGKENVNDRVLGYIVGASPSKTSLANSLPLGWLTFTSEVVVNGKQVLYQNTTTGLITEENKKQLIQVAKIARKQLGTNFTIFDDLDKYEQFGFVWDDLKSYRAGVNVVVLATLAQATREPIKTAAVMSILNSHDLNSRDLVPRRFDISCEEDFRLPRTASIIIVVIGVICRLVLIFIPTSKPSVEFALEQPEEYPIYGETKAREQP